MGPDKRSDLCGSYGFFVPILLTNLVQQLYLMVDLMVMGKFVGNAGTVGVSKRPLADEAVETMEIIKTA